MFQRTAPSPHAEQGIRKSRASSSGEHRTLSPSQKALALWLGGAVAAIECGLVLLDAYAFHTRIDPLVLLVILAGVYVLAPLLLSFLFSRSTEQATVGRKAGTLLGWTSAFLALVGLGTWATVVGGPFTPSPFSFIYLYPFVALVHLFGVGLARLGSILGSAFGTFGVRSRPERKRSADPGAQGEEGEALQTVLPRGQSEEGGKVLENAEQRDRDRT